MCAGIVLGIGSANKMRCCIITSLPIGGAHTLNDPSVYVIQSCVSDLYLLCSVHQTTIIHAMLRVDEGSERIWYLLVGMGGVMDLCSYVRSRFRMIMIKEIRHVQDLLQRTRSDFVSFFATSRWWCINNDAITRKVGNNNIANRFRGGTESCKAK